MHVGTSLTSTSLLHFGFGSLGGVAARWKRWVGHGAGAIVCVSRRDWVGRGVVGSQTDRCRDLFGVGA